jgi:DNA polymerase-3 subunit epsilon
MTPPTAKAGERAVNRTTLNFMAIDFETANYSSDSACSIGLVKVNKGKIVYRKAHLIKPPTRQFVFTYVHGLTWTDVMKAPTFGELWIEIEPLFEGIDFLAAHNAKFDQRVLAACCERYGVEFPKLPFECSMNLARKVWNIYPTKLPDVCKHLEIELNHHEALSDSLACAQIILASNSSVAQKDLFA